MGKTKIQWTDRAWNPTVGCSRVSTGCIHCYAETMAARIANAAQAALRAGKKLTDVQEAYRKVVMWKRGGMFAADLDDVALPKWNNRVELVPSRLMDPMGDKKPQKWFVDSMSDIFHPEVSFDYLFEIWLTMALSPDQTFQILTKRPERAAEFLAQLSVSALEDRFLGVVECSGLRPARLAKMVWSWPLKNVWLGTSCENQKEADERIPHLLRCPSAIRFLSCEPLLGPIDLRNLNNGEYCAAGLKMAILDVTEEDLDEVRRTSHLDALAGIATAGKDTWCEIGAECEPLHWVIAGGESGHGARSMDPQDAHSLMSQCKETGVAFFMKQMGAKPVGVKVLDSHGADWEGYDELRVKQFPEVVNASS